MDIENRKSKTRRIREWFKRKNKRADAYQWNEVSDDSEDDNLHDDLVRSLEIDPCIFTNELRIFVGTWNVAGRSPVGSLAVDVNEWLNLKDAADMYVLGFQEIVPLKTKNVIGGEDPTEATNWNLLIGKTLNDKYGCPWLTPMLNPISSEHYHFVRFPGFGRRASFSGHSGFTGPELSKAQQEEEAYGCSKYKLMASKKMVGVFISVWMKKEFLTKYRISDVKVSSVACGIMGYLGNKGSVSVSMSIEGTSFCFITAHLASGEKRGDEGRRNHQVSEIFRRTSFPRSSEDDDNPHPITILGHDRIFWFGDLNYRLYQDNNLAKEFIKKQDWKALQEFDQLRKELEDGGVFEGWREGNIEFAPTYKYSSANCNRYTAGLPGRSGEKQRTPAWCDRILWYGKGVRQLSYFRSESKFSDHRPVSALFSIPIEVMKVTNPRKVFPTGTFLPMPSGKLEPIDSKGGARSTLLSLFSKESVNGIGSLP
ncbi:PREDICTED: type I inositol 1,4,5-trisphosphate 5-phosphatase CVP2-like isoform X1 [Populus euphratica]|uniref:Type I inositol 1,4,5-trisphosphate 5-phosphatase CVP2-like isoform X1 n=1 Tax=Populus euphratica TaxID=75702 RepID=A0AAJ6X8A9_POPEU|nr:PREDICTED: type I inositol 1,4,5-trisphosphate 5-phosphatase CVP2-like isoform X1 [Populus euphratica]